MIFSSSLLLFVSLAFAFFHSHHAAPVDDNEKIVGGQVAVANAYDWEVSLGEMDKVPPNMADRQKQPAAVKLANHFCGGSLLTSNWVLTAAHCVVNDLTKDDPLPAASIGVGVGRDLVDIYNQGRIPAAKVIIKKGYTSESPSSKEDIALIQLSKPITGVKKFACLPKADTALYTPTITAIGWGNIYPLEHDGLTGKWEVVQAPQTMKQVTMKDVSNSATSCKGRPDLICINSTQNHDGSCKGDSGGSLVWNDKTVVGVTSFGGAVKSGQYKIKTCNGDAAYTRLSKNIAWIKQYVKEDFCVQ